jgi:hypothetical protein
MSGPARPGQSVVYWAWNIALPGTSPYVTGLDAIAGPLVGVTGFEGERNDK